jgi:SAM-dependent methyltransferase
MPDEPYIFDQTASAAELARLRALESVFDLGTRRRLLATGLDPGWRCLEVGAGAGSVARWMAAKVGKSGRVLALDANPRFLKELDAPNVEVLHADVCTANLPPASMDLVHARFVLIHVPNWQQALKTMIASLKPGGWLLLEEPDFTVARDYAGDDRQREAFARMQNAIRAVFQARKLDPAFGAGLPALFEARHFNDIEIEHEAPIVSGGSPLARMMRLSVAGLHDRCLATGLLERSDFDRYEAFCLDPHAWAVHHASVRALGRKPT